MVQLRSNIDNFGKILIPLQIRKELKIKTGDTFVIRVIDGEVRMISLNKIITQVQQTFRKYVPEGTPVVDDFIEHRRQESEKERS